MMRRRRRPRRMPSLFQVIVVDLIMDACLSLLFASLVFYSPTLFRSVSYTIVRGVVAQRGGRKTFLLFSRQQQLWQRRRRRKRKQRVDIFFEFLGGVAASLGECAVGVRALFQVGSHAHRPRRALARRHAQGCARRLPLAAPTQLRTAGKTSSFAHTCVCSCSAKLFY